MQVNRAISLLVGVAVCSLLLAMHHFGLFEAMGAWLEGHFAKLLVPAQEGTLKTFLPLQYAYYTVLAFVSAWVCLELDLASRKVGYLLAAVFLTLSLSPLLALNGILFEPFSGTLAILVAGLLAMVIGGTDKGQRKHRLRSYFVGRLSSDQYERLVKRRQNTDALTERREITVVTCRLINHAELATEMEPADLERFSSSFLKVVAEFLVSKGGYLDACNVHRVRVLFGYPVAIEPHAETAVEVALELNQRIANLTQEMEARWNKKPQIGVALCSGEAACGLFGFEQFEFFTAVGEVAGFGDRLAPVNAVYGSRLLLASSTHQAAKDAIEVRPMEMVFAPGLAPVSEVYELLGLKGDLGEDETKARDAFWQGVVQLRKGDYEAAKKSFKEAEIEGVEDAPLAYFKARAETGPEKGGGKGEGKSPRHVRMLLPS